MTGLQPIGTKELISHNQTAHQIIDYLCKAVKDSQRYYPELNKHFNTGDDLETLKGIFNFAKDNFHFIPEPPENQNVKTVARVLENPSNDCKGYSSFVINAARACGIEANYRLASYNFYDKTPKHVYVVAKVDGQQFILDPTPKHRFNEESAYKHAFDVNPITKKKMALNYLSGVPGQADYDTIGRSKKREERKAKRKEKKATKKEARKEKREERRDTRKEKKGERKDKRKQRVAKIAAAPARAAFLAIVATNFLKIADKLAAAYKKDQQGTMNFWAKLGGKWETLRKAISKGSKQTITGGDEVGAVTLAAAIATATPILIALKSFISKLGLFQGKEEAELDNSIEDGIDLLDQDPNVEKTFLDVDEDSDSDVFNVQKKGLAMKVRERRAAPPTQKAQTRDVDENTFTNDSPSNDGGGNGESFDYKKLIIPGIAAAGIFLLTRKR